MPKLDLNVTFWVIFKHCANNINTYSSLWTLFLSLDFAQNVICKGDFIEGFEVSKKNYEVLKTDFC